MDLLFDWEEDRDRYSFEDSDRFEDDSFCSWISEPESLCNNWRGWRKPNNGLGNAPATGNFSVQFFPATLTPSVVSSVFPTNQQKTGDVQLLSLTELTAKAVACYIPFEVVEHFFPPIPEQLQLRIAFWSFPENEDDIRLYSCLANGSADEFVKGEFHYKTKCISDVLQIGFHLSGSVVPAHFNKGPYSVAVTFDRRHITSCTCTCNSTASWCSHVVALCLFRIHQSSNVCLRAPVSESLSRLGRDQLQKFAQYLISELPQHFLPTAQRLLDELLSSQRNDINTVCGAPDPTAGPSATEQTTWCLDEAALHENIKKTLVKFCIPSPVVLSDVNYLSSNSPPAATEYQSLLRPLRGREPEGIWNLLLIIREMFKRRDSNAIPLLEILTEEILECDMILTWWYNNKMITNYQHQHHHQNNHHNQFYQPGTSRLTGGGGSGQAGSSVTQHAASSLCDELVALWRLATLNPSLASAQQHDLAQQLRDYHINSLEKLYCRNRGQAFYGKDEMESFPGFKPAFEACLLDWNVLKPPNSEDHEDVALKCSAPFWVRSLMKIRSDGEILKIVHAKGNNKDNQPSCCFLNSLSSTYPLKEGETNGDADNHILQISELSTTNIVASQFADQSYFADIRKVMGVQEIKFAVAEALYAHGHLAEASELARELAEEMLNNCQSSSSDQHQSNKHVTSTDADKRKRVQASNNPAFQMLANASFLCSVLLENTHNNLIAFKIGIYALEMNRPPAPTKQLEVKLAYQESELANQLKKIPLTYEELNIIRDRAEKLKDGRIKSRGEAMLPVTLAAFIFDSLCLSGNKPGTTIHTTSADEKLGFESAVIALGLKANVSEAEHPLLCEGLRRQRGELAIALLVHCKDDPAKLARVMDKILDRDVHQLYKTPPPWYAYLNESPAAMATAAASSSLSSSSSSSSSSSGVSMTSPSSTTTMTSSFVASVASMALNLSAPVNSSSSSLTNEASSSLSSPSVAQTTPIATVCSTAHPAKPPQTSSKKAKAPTPSMLPLSLQMVALQLSESSKSPPSEKVVKVSTTSALRDRGAECSKASNDVIAESLCDPSDYLPGEVDAGIGAMSEDEAQQRLQGSEKIHSVADDDFTGDDEDASGRNKYKEWEAKFRCTNLKTIKKPSVGMASVDSSAPETTSSDNSPTLSRRTMKQPASPHHHHHLNPSCPDSDSGSSHESFDFNNSDVQAGSAPSRDADSPPVSQLFENIYQPQQTLTGHGAINGLMNAKVTRYKGKNRIMPLLPNQPSEALAHFMFELAKTILIKAGGNVSTSLFTQHSINFQTSSSSNNATSGNNSGNSNGGPNGPHRALHLCAFQIGLYALGLNNRVSPNWISRTYSSLVSWINGQATEIGPAAIKILTQSWENHLTPQEAASLADRASRCRDPSMVSAAAELALSCLSFASFLNTNEIHIALNQCKDQSSEMLQRACLSVEMAAKDGGVHSEVLFEIAKRWYELYTGPIPAATAPSGFHGERRTTSNPPAEQVAMHMPPPLNQREELNLGLMDSRLPGYPRTPYAIQQYGFQPQQLFYHQPPQQPQHPSPSIHHQQHYLAPQSAQPYLSAPPFSYLSIHPSPSNNSVVTFPGNQNHYFPPHQVIRHRGGQQIVQMNLAQHVLPIPVQTPPSYQIAFVGQNNVPPGAWPPVFGYQQYPVDPMQQGVMVASLPPPNALHLQQVAPSLQSSLPPSTQYPPQLPTSGASTSAHSGSQPPVASSVYFLYAAYRVGMLAMEALARKVHDDRPQIKFSRNPPYGEDVKWLLEVSIKLGTSHVQQFCASTCTAVLSPFILSDIAIDMAKAFSSGNINQMNQNLRIPFIQSLLQKSSQMFVQCTHARIHHIVPQDYEEFINILYSARKVFLLIPDGQTQFNELINGLKRSKSCKKDLWQRIVGLLN